MPTFLLAAAWPDLITQGSRNSVQEIMCLPDFSGRTTILLDYWSDKPCVTRCTGKLFHFQFIYHFVLEQHFGNVKYSVDFLEFLEFFP